uniref:RlpA-like protein double-psi beta-barrel domain-containing protein n=1 Tax=Oryza rufipogon TaxID=4529 RepID=A0A0E0Q1W1_ORYRU
MAKIAFLLAAALLLGLVSVSQAIQGTATFYTTYNRTPLHVGVLRKPGQREDDRGSERRAVGRRQDLRDDVHGAVRRATNAVPNPCRGGAITVKIVDRCPGSTATLDLSREAFAAIANPVAGKVLIDYQQYALDEEMII